MPAPDADVDVDATLVQSLLSAQHADLAGLPITEVASGWDNVVFRLGDDLAVRLPRRELGAQLAIAEQRWLAELAPRLPLPIPAPVRIGRPGPGYPWTWSVVPWFHGEEAALADPTDWADAATRLGAFLRALHRPAPADAPISPYRGIRLVERHELMAQGLDRLGDQVDRAPIDELWAMLAATPEREGPPVWVHGDLHPRNLVIHDGQLAAVLDFGDLTQGDPAVDLSVAWFWLPADVRPVFRAAAGGADDDTWRRAKGWALALAIAHLGGDERVIRQGRHALDAVLADAA